MTTSSRNFISPSGKDNFTRLSVVEGFALVDAIFYLEAALNSGESQASGLSSHVYLKVQEKLAEAFEANTLRRGAIESLKDYDKVEKAEEEIKAKFKTIKENREKGLI